MCNACDACNECNAGAGRVLLVPQLVQPPRRSTTRSPRCTSSAGHSEELHGAGPARSARDLRLEGGQVLCENGKAQNEYNEYKEYIGKNEAILVARRPCASKRKEGPDWNTMKHRTWPNLDSTGRPIQA